MEIIYALFDPRTDEIRYIGQSSCGLKRAKAHGSPSALAKNLPVTHWISKLRREGVKYGIRILEEAPVDGLDVAEVRWIREARAGGLRLLNLTDGGGGNRGWRLSDATRQRMSVGQTRRWDNAGRQPGYQKQPPNVSPGGGSLTCPHCRRDDLTDDDFHGETCKATWCRGCRSSGYFERRYPTPCAGCAQHRKLDRNGKCMACNADQGLRECRRCSKLLPIGMSFHGIRRSCVECRKLGARTDHSENEG